MSKGAVVAWRLTLRELRSEDEYEAELAMCVGVTGFHRWFFLRALSESLGFRMRAFAVEKGGSSVGVLPILLRRRGPVSTANYLPVPHVGPLPRDATPLADVLAAADPYLLRQLAVSTKWAFAPDSPITPEPLYERGFQVKVDENFVVPAGRTPEEHLATLGKQLRRDIRSGPKRGIKASPADIEEIRDWFADQVVAPYQRQGIAPDYSRVAALRLIDRLGEDPRMSWRSLLDDSGQLLAVTANIIDVDRLWGWLLVGNRGNPSPHTLGYWDSIEWSLSRGLSCDLSGAPNSGIRDLKLRMGAVSEPCLVAERVKPQVYRKLRSLHTRIAGHQAKRSAHKHAD